MTPFTTYITQTQEEHGVPPNKHYEIPFVRGMPCSSFPKGTQLRVAAFVAPFTTYITPMQEEHGMPPNKHYEIPFVRGYAVLFPYAIKERHKAA